MHLSIEDEHIVIEMCERVEGCTHFRRDAYFRRA